MEKVNKSAQRISLYLISVYRYWISPTWGYCCRYYPSCSEYAQTAITRHGFIRGGWLALRRILRCHPWGKCGYDPVPDKKYSRKLKYGL